MEQILKNLDFKGNYPLFYMYNGDGDELESMLLTDTKKMIKYLENINYPKDKIIFKEYKKACHNEHFWRSIFLNFYITHLISNKVENKNPKITKTIDKSF